MPTTPASIAEISACINAGIFPAARTIYLAGSVDDQMARTCLGALLMLDAPKTTLRVVVNSHGGSTIAGFAIYDALRACAAKVVTIATGECYSMGMAILQAGDERLVMPSARLMLHSISDSCSSDYVRYLEQSVAEGRKHMDIYGKLVGGRMGISGEEFWNRYENGVHYFSASAALAAGLVDGIIGEGN